MRASLHQADRNPAGFSAPAFPSTRYQGSKARLADWIWEQIAGLDFHTCLDAFGGTGAVSYRLKQAGKAVTYNDVLRFNTIIGKALIENNREQLSSADVDGLLRRNLRPAVYPRWVEDTFSGIYFTDVENAWIDQTITNIQPLASPDKQALAFFALCQACMIKRPYNLFHRRNLYLRFADVQRSFGNKASWDRPFEEWFRAFVLEANHAVFDNGQPNRALNLDAVDVPGEYDLVYIDPPYVSARGVGVDYRGFYHFLEGLATYDTWADEVDWQSRHRRLRRRPNPWQDKTRILGAFENVLQRFASSIVVVSYRNDGIPSQAELVQVLQRHKRHVCVAQYGRYRYALSTNQSSGELLLIGT